MFKTLLTARNRIRRQTCLFVSLCMLVGQFAGLQVQAASVTGAVESGGIKATELTGLLGTDEINWDNPDVPAINQDATWGEKFYATLNGMTLALIERETAEADGTAIILSEENTEVKFKESEEATDWTDISDDNTITFSTNTGNDTLTDLSFEKCGLYQISCTSINEGNNCITIEVSLPEIGFYNAQTANDDTFMRTLDLADTSSPNEFYMILNQTDKTTTFDGFMINWDTDMVPDDYIGCEETDSENVYKISIYPYNIYPHTDGIDLVAKASCIDTENNFWETQTCLHIGESEAKPFQWTEDFDEETWTDNGPTDIIPDAWYNDGSENIWHSRPYVRWLAFLYDSRTINEAQLEICDTKGTKIENAHILKGTNESDGIVGIHLPKAKNGTYIIVYKENNKILGACRLELGYPDVGFYKTGTLSDAGLLEGEENASDDYELYYGKENDNVFYLLYSDDSALTVSDVKIQEKTYNHDTDQLKPIDGVQYGDYVQIEDLYDTENTDKVIGHKLTLKENVDTDFFVEVTFIKNFQWKDDNGTIIEEDGPYDDTISIHLMPKKTFDLSQVKWTYTGAFTYDGQAKTVELADLPQELTVSYSGNMATEVGDYTAKATFSYNERLYNAPDISKISELKWSIIKKDATASPAPDKTPVPSTSPAAPGTPATSEPPKTGESLTVDGTTYKVTATGDGKGNDEVSYVGGDKDVTKAVIPATITVNDITYKVTAIADNAFNGCKKLKSVAIGKNIFKIGNKALYKCTSLQKLTIPASVSIIGKQAFCGCNKLKSIMIKSKNLTSKSVGASAFKDIHKKAAITVPKKQKKAYKKWLQTKGIAKSVKIK